jgi:hypothetical protein
MTSTAVVKAEQFTSDDLTKFLQQSGWAEKSSGDAPLRMKLDGNMLVTPDGEMFVYNPTKPKIPALTARIVKPPEEYWAIWIDADAARLIGQPELQDSFSKKYVHPDPDRRTWDSDAAFDQLKNAGVKASWKADILLQVMPETGNLTGDEPVYTLTLSTTSLIEFKGASREPDKGAVSEKNFIRKLCEFSIEADPKNGKQAVTAALLSLTLGGVVAEIRLLRAENKELGRSWTVISFDPIYIEQMFEGEMLLSGSDDAEAGN